MHTPTSSSSRPPRSAGRLCERRRPPRLAEPVPARRRIAQSLRRAADRFDSLTAVDAPGCPACR